ncbi:MAG: hypothetical protein LBC72_05110 [Spirochaetaceae bacterium]|jgi:hypothetical protein|nr:hypothetical protein [Spirochaetaceae bacterium]
MENIDPHTAAPGGAARRTTTPSPRHGKGLSIRDLLLIGILLAAGAVLKFFAGTVINFGMKPNFIIAMYCLAILIVRPRLAEAAIIGLLSGAVCQFFPGQPFINFASELAGAAAMCLLARIPLEKLKIPVKPAITTFLSTLVSGFSFIGVMYLMYYSGANITPAPLAIFLAIILGTATINAVIVQILYLPLAHFLKPAHDNI